jgi:ankyrin repeat protein
MRWSLFRKSAEPAESGHTVTLSSEIIELIHQAARDGDLTAVRTLLKDNRDVVFAKDTYGRTPLHRAAAHGNKDVAQLLLANKAEVDARDAQACTPLHHAALWGHLSVVELLLANHASVNAKDKWYYTPLVKAKSKGHENVAKILLRHGGVSR